jgi:hypothetical protein
MRVIVEILGRVVGFEASLLHVKMVSTDDQQQDEFEHAPMDPHGTLSAHIERRSDMEDAFGKQKFGFAHVTDTPDGSQG